MEDHANDPRPERSRALILPAATEHFLAHGYLGGNVDEIAAEAGVSKRTIYNLYDGKEHLFRAVVHAMTQVAARFSTDLVGDPVGDRPIADELESLAILHATAVLDPRVVRVRRLLIGETERFPDLAAEYYAAAPERVIAALADRLRRYPELRLPDALLAAEHFAFLVLGASLDRALFHQSGTVDRESCLQRARAGAGAFLAVYRV